MVVWLNHNFEGRVWRHATCPPPPSRLNSDAARGFCHNWQHFVGLYDMKRMSTVTLSPAETSIADVPDACKHLEGGDRLLCPRLGHHGVVHVS